MPLRTRHETLYKAWGDIILAAEDVLFRVHSGFLKSESKLFETLLQMPPPKTGVEGASDELPIVLPVPAAHLALLLKCVVHRDVVLTTDEKLIVLDLSSFLLMHDMRAWILRELSHASPAPTALQQIAYGVRAQLPDWIASGFYGLVEFPSTQLSQISGDASNIVGFTVYKLLFDTIQKISRIRLYIAHTVGDFKAGKTCKNPGQCKALWLAHAYAPFAQRYLHPTSPLKASKAQFWLAGCHMPHLCNSCLTDNMERLDDQEMWFLEELTMINAEDTLQAMISPFPAPAPAENVAMSTE